MRVNVYAGEMTERVEIIAKEIDGHSFTGLRFYLELPATVNGQNVSGPFMHRPGDDDSSAVTFWGKQDLRRMLRRSFRMLDEHYGVSKTGVLEVGIDENTGEVVVNHPNVSPDDEGVGHIVFSRAQALALAKLLTQKANERAAPTEDSSVAIRGLARAINNRSVEFLEGNELADAKDLARALARLLSGESLKAAFGAPGDWGYSTPIGIALAGCYSAREQETCLDEAVRGEHGR